MSEINFPSDSPINTDKLGKQNKAVYDHLDTGKTLNRIQAINLGITTALNSRISQLRNNYHIKIYDRFIYIGKSRLKEYSLKEF